MISHPEIKSFFFPEFLKKTLLSLIFRNMSTVEEGVSFINPKPNGKSRNHAYIILTPLNSIYIVKLGFIGVYIIFHTFARKIDCGYSLELPQ